MCAPNSGRHLQLSNILRPYLEVGLLHHGHGTPGDGKRTPRLPIETSRWRLESASDSYDRERSRRARRRRLI
jgi:hypothetical protein